MYVGFTTTVNEQLLLLFEASIAVLKKMTRERDKNVFLISHRDDLTSRVNHVLKVIKENGFTSYSNDVEIVT